jgi:hypothetical protein
VSKTKSEIIFSFSSAKGYEVQSLMLLRSLRTFGGGFSDMPVWIFVPQEMPHDPKSDQELINLGAEIMSYPIQEPLKKFPFALKTFAAAEAEKLAEEQHALLAWHDRTGFICNPPHEFDLPKEKAIAFRPTDIANIGSPYSQYLTPFWQDIISTFDLKPDKFPPITTTIDQIELYLYVNAGLMVVRPEKKIFRTWAKNLEDTYDLPKFKTYYQQNSAYAIFMHQAALTAAVIQNTMPEERLILSDHYLFSVDNFFDYPNKSRPNTLDEIITGRFHDFFALENWESKVIASPKLITWFKEQLLAGPYWSKSA